MRQHSRLRQVPAACYCVVHGFTSSQGGLFMSCSLDALNMLLCGFSQSAGMLLQLNLRQGEHAALLRLLGYVQQPKADKGEPLKLCHKCNLLAVIPPALKQRLRL